MNLSTALRVTVIIGWAGLLLEFARTNLWAAAIITAALWLGWSDRRR